MQDTLFGTHGAAEGFSSSLRTLGSRALPAHELPAFIPVAKRLGKLSGHVVQALGREGNAVNLPLPLCFLSLTALGRSL